MKTPIVAALRIRTHTHAIEAKIDELMGEVGLLFAEMTDFASASDLARADGQRPLARVTQLQGKLLEARGKIVGAHADMARIAERADFPTMCPPSAERLDAANG